MKIRGFAMGIAVFVLWMANFAISQLFLTINRAAGSTWTFLIFLALGILSLISVARWVPETKGHSLEDLESGFRQRYSATPAATSRARS